MQIMITLTFGAKLSSWHCRNKKRKKEYKKQNTPSGQVEGFVVNRWASGLMMQLTTRTTTDERLTTGQQPTDTVVT
eukprot:1153759-Rhodomonas_salina.1